VPLDPDVPLEPLVPLVPAPPDNKFVATPALNAVTSQYPPLFVPPVSNILTLF
jgi:hypothetical protein